MASENFNFNPFVWETTIQAYLRRKNVFFNLAFLDETLVTSSGTSVLFPYYTLLSGSAQKIAPDQQVAINQINNDKFTISVAELADSVALTDSQRLNLVTRAAGMSQGNYDAYSDPFDDWSEEAMRQMAFRFVSQIDADLVTLLQQAGSYVQAFTATAGTDVFTNDLLTRSKLKAFGDRTGEAKTVVCHPLQFADFITSVGGLAAFNMNAIRQDIQEDGFFQGRYNGVDFYLSDNVPKYATQIGGKDAYTAYVFKRDPFGVMTKMKPSTEHKRDILGRRDIIVATTWYGTINLNQQISSTDIRTAALLTTVN